MKQRTLEIYKVFSGTEGSVQERPWLLNLGHPHTLAVCMRQIKSYSRIECRIMRGWTSPTQI